MKTIIAGSRCMILYVQVEAAIKASGFSITEVVSGCARGPDTLAIRWANTENIPVKAFPADWAQHGKRAGSIRNQQMAEYAEALIAVWDGKSYGTKDMIDKAIARGLKVFIHKV